ncbi:tape measure protein [Notoacmeibacter ruber]|uniref:Tape measure protein N-terminal domain-containing protein n=1 Tax=Notoacmeibacter ruber TaxID=2670375 RepID=A0A3L7J9D0_9HYPH|nr:tape measure protein [Notoacmeibacter ruber]RLQ87089.1 hypothetical protein D8780_01535 [Notoacmeibacter ruber]
MAYIDEIVALLGFEYRDDGSARRFEDGMKRMEKRAEKVGRSIGKFVAVAGAAATTGMAAFGKSIIATGAQFEAFGVQLSALEGSKEKGQAALDWITDFAVQTPLELADAVRAYAQLRTYGLDPTAGSMQALTDAMAATGGGSEKLMGLATGLGQAWTKGRLQGEEIMQLMERGIPVWDMLAEATGKNVEQLQEMSSKGRLGREEIKLLINEIAVKYKGASAEYSRTFDGMMSNILDSWTKFKKQISDSGAFESVKLIMQDVLDWFKAADSNGTIDYWAQTISDAFVSVTKALQWSVGQIKMHVNTIKGFFRDDAWQQISDNLKPILTAFGLLMARLFPITALFIALGLAVDDWLTYMAGGESVIGDMVAAISAFLGAEPEKVAEILGEIAKAAGWLAAAALGVGLFGGAIRSLAGALVLLKGVSGVVGLLRRLGGVGSAMAAGSAGVNATASSSSNKGRVGIGRQAIGALGAYQLGSNMPTSMEEMEASGKHFRDMAENSIFGDINRWLMSLRDQLFAKPQMRSPRAVAGPPRAGVSAGQMGDATSLYDRIGRSVEGSATLKVEEYLNPAKQAEIAAQKLERDITANADVNTSSFTAKLRQMELQANETVARINQSMGRIGAGRSSGPMAPRPTVEASAGQP